MTCNEARSLIPAHLDEELDVVHDADVVAHLNECPACADAALAHAARRGLVRDHATRFGAPAGLEAQLRESLLGASQPRPVRPRWLGPWLSLPLAAGLAVATAGGYYWGTRVTQRHDQLAALTSSHVRSALSGHAIDVESTDRHTVKPWFAGKLDFTPPVVDLALDGFPLVGGRLDYLDGRRVAVLVYRRRLHVIDVYLEPAGTASSLGESVQSGFNIVTWKRGEFRGSAISDLALDELKAFAQLWQEKAP